MVGGKMWEGGVGYVMPDLTGKQNDFKTAANRACDNQHNSCAELANNKTGKFSVGECDKQSSEFILFSTHGEDGWDADDDVAECKSAISTATTTSFSALFSSNAEFDFFCDT
jgi:hypothetical protein